ncbi:MULTISPECIES: restriction endonuclease subunit S [Clostridium]|uniref:restriction endonuclease subunit S n=1 Tax=Clostridium TaxID=1485 RepID=UPI000774E539|nr:MULTISPECIES: restriction endonuclease subunit S [Clostridium]AUM94582.1 hypothetical protein RSJ11_05185 [Clostridium sporogenes]AVQ52016.1 hypothetical protein C7M59_03710 [Clostridium botulinum]
MKKIRLGDICNIKSSKRIYQSEYTDKGVPFYRGKEISELCRGDNPKVELYISRERYNELESKFGSPKKGDLFITSVGTIGNTWISDGREFYYKDGNITQIVDNDGINTKYLSYLFESDILKRQYMKGSTGTAQVALTIEKLNNLVIPIGDLEIQQKIVNVLDKAQSLIDKRKAQIEALDELVKSRFIEMFGNPVINSKGWEIKDLGILGYFKNGMNYNQSDSGFNIKFLGVGEFKYGNVINSSNMLSTLELQEEPNEEYLLKNGDIVFVRSNGSKELVGRSVLIRELEEKTTYSGFCIRYRNQCEELIPDFLIQLFSDENFKKSFKKDSRGANINNLNQQMLSSLKIIVPPIELQNQFAGFVKQADKLKFEMEKSLKELEDNFNSLMQKAFNGELFN